MKIFQTGSKIVASLILLSGSILSLLTTSGLFFYGQKLPDTAYKGRYIDVLTLAGIVLLVSLIALLLKFKKVAVTTAIISLMLLLLRNPWAWEGRMWDNPWLFPPLTVGLMVMMLLGLLVCSAALVGLKRKPVEKSKSSSSKVLKMVDFLMLFA